MRASDLFVRCLEKEQIEYVFGVPGEENAEFLLALDDSKQIRFINTRHEQPAAFMADVYGRLTGNPALALGTLGPGATNLVTGVANARASKGKKSVRLACAAGSDESQLEIRGESSCSENDTRITSRIGHCNRMPT